MNKNSQSKLSSKLVHATTDRLDLMAPNLGFWSISYDEYKEPPTYLGPYINQVVSEFPRPKALSAFCNASN